MGVSKGRTNLSLEEILSRVSESQLLTRYLGITQVPCVISSPLRQDIHPSFGLSSPDGKKIRYRDFATGETGGIIDLLGQMWRMSFEQVLSTIQNDSFNEVAPAEIVEITTEHVHSTVYAGNTKLEIKVREWTKDDKDYWKSYGVPIELLKKANVYPISHYFITKNGYTMTFKADKYAYAFVEYKEENLTIKVYQPFNKGHFKWINKHDKSVLGLWRMMPEKGEIVCICSSVKDALCLTANTGIPAICLQGEAYEISETAQRILMERFERVCILLDNDEPGKKDANKLQQKTGFINIELPPFEGGKDISDLYKSMNDPDKFKTTILNLFEYDKKRNLAIDFE